MDRDDRIVTFAAAKGAGRERMTSHAYNLHSAWGGATRASDTIMPTREDVQSSRTVPGRTVRIGYARYVSPTVDPYDYKYYHVSGWRVAIPRATPVVHVDYLLNRIIQFGPRSAGYVRIGDSLVPGSLGPGERVTIAESAVEESPV
jgi:hypothetical protein